MIILTKNERDHYTHELTTASFIKLCYKITCKKLTPEKLYALCQLTWWSPANYYTPSKLHALWTLWEMSDEIPKGFNIVNLKKYGFPDKINKYEIENIGIVNYYKAYRKISYKWITKNFAMLNDLTKKVISLESDEEALSVIQAIEKLPYIPKPNNQKGAAPSENLLTPLFACLDPRLRFPIINKAHHVKALHRKLGITGYTLTDKYLTLVNLINQMGIKDCMMLDSVSNHISNMPIKIKETPPKTKHQINGPNLGGKDSDDIEVLLNTRKIVFTHLHNKMTNKLKILGEQNKYIITEGAKEPNKYDALIQNYNGKGRDLLIEVKSTSERACLRLAIGQLFDYRRFLIRRAVTDLSIMLPRKPQKSEMELLDYIGINALWFKDKRMTHIQSNFGFSLR